MGKLGDNMAKFILSFIFLFLFSRVDAAVTSPGGLLSTPETATITISSATATWATAVVAYSSAAITSVAVENLGTSNLFCSARINTTSSGANRGFKIWPTQVVTFMLKAGNLFYCINDGAATSEATVVRGR